MGRPSRLLPVSLALSILLAACGGGGGGDGDGTTTFLVTIENLDTEPAATGVFDTPVGAASARIALPGEAFEVTFRAAPGERVSFATMYGQSNDLFFAPGPAGISLYDASGDPVTGDVSSQVDLWDAGTEVNETPGAGPNQAPRQAAPDTGPEEMAPVRSIDDVMDGFSWFRDVVVTLAHDGDAFTLRIENPAGSPTPLSPGVWIVHTEDGPLFTPGRDDALPGLEAQAEDGNPAGLAGVLGTRFGLRQAILFDTPVGGASTGPAAPGEAFEITFDASPGDRVSFATMYGQSNDLVFGFGDDGVALYDAGGAPRTGDMSAEVVLWDAGTEVNETPGAGPNQAPRQPEPDSGIPEAAPVRPVSETGDGFDWFEDLDVTLSHDGASFTLRIDNPAGSPTPLSPGVVVIHSTGNPFLVDGLKDRGLGLEALAERGSPAGLFADLASRHGLAEAGVFDTPVGAGAAGPATPGSAYRFRFEANPGDRLSFATMYGQSNDLFFGPGPDGIELFDPAGNPITGDVSSLVGLWDAGTEVNEEPGVGPNQAPRQAAPDTGAVEDAPVRSIDDVADGFDWFRDVEAELTYDGTRFELTITNPAGSTTPLSPGVWVVHREPGPLFTPGVKDRREGLEAQAEDGSPTRLLARILGPLASTARRAAFRTPLSPGVWAVHASGSPVFTNGVVQPGNGLEALAESGDPTTLAANLDGSAGVLASGAYNTPQGAASAGPAGPGHAYVFEVAGIPGARLSFASMFGQSNDVFFAPDAAGIALFDASGQPIDADVTSLVIPWDAGTEVNERPGGGAHQAPRQASPDAGRTESAPVVPVRDRGDGYVYPWTGHILRVTIAPR